jgi:hypothetical protein
VIIPRPRFGDKLVSVSDVVRESENFTYRSEPHQHGNNDDPSMSPSSPDGVAAPELESQVNKREEHILVSGLTRTTSAVHVTITPAI